MGFQPTYHFASTDLRKSLFYDNEWEFMEWFALLTGRKFDGLAAGVSAGVSAATLGQNPLMFGGPARQIVEYGYKIIEGLSFFEILRMRSALKKYLLEMRLL